MDDTDAGWRTSSRVWVENPLFSHTKSTGACRITAKLSVSWKMPSSTVPSPKKVTASWSRPSIVNASAVPTATAIVWPRIAEDAITPTSGSLRWTDPPRPRAQPVSRP